MISSILTLCFEETQEQPKLVLKKKLTKNVFVTSNILGFTEYQDLIVLVQNSEKNIVPVSIREKVHDHQRNMYV